MLCTYRCRWNKTLFFFLLFVDMVIVSAKTVIIIASLTGLEIATDAVTEVANIFLVRLN